jgi:hypothetical protein
MSWIVVGAPMRGFSKLSRLQWQILTDLVRQEARGFANVFDGLDKSRQDGMSEAARVATLRALASLCRRGLIIKHIDKHIDGQRRWPRYRLAVSPRIVFNATYEHASTGVDVKRLRRYVEQAERRGR